MQAPGSGKWRRDDDRHPRQQQGWPSEWVSASAGLAVHGVPTVPTAVLLHLEPVGVVAAVLARDVVPLLALHAGQRDLRADVGALGGHGTALSRCGGGAVVLLGRARWCRARVLLSFCGRPAFAVLRPGDLVAGAGLE